MGIVNVTPDSFSDGGAYADPSAAIARGAALRAAGADILDIGGESTRPGAAELSVAEELARVMPVIEGLAATGAVLSIDTRRPPIMAAALDAGARIVNDVSGFRDPAAQALVARRRPAVIVMHMRGEPATMQRNPRYRDAAREVFEALAARVTELERAGLPRDRIMVDPGIGFGKTTRHNLDILARLDLYRAIACPVAIGVSRKGFIATIAGDADPQHRLGGSIAAALAAVAGGAALVRVHDVAETAQALRVWAAIGHTAVPPFDPAPIPS